MVIKSLSDAEDIVNSISSLSWDGWTIVHKVQDDSAEYDVRGSYDREVGKWFRRIPYPCIENTGWVVPDSLLKR